MPSPWSMIPAYPPQEMSEYLRAYDKIHVYVDLKNSLNSLWIKDIQEEIKENSRNFSKMCDSSIFQSSLVYSAYWLKNARAKGKDCKVFLITDHGTSAYHTGLSSKYKESRDISNTNNVVHGLLDNEVKVIRDKNFELSNRVMNRLPYTYYIDLPYLESDFVCHYLITRKFDQDDILHVIVSSDKDMFQTVTKPNIVQIYSRMQTRYMLDMNTVMPKYLKIDKLAEKNRTKKLSKLKDFDMAWIPAVMAMVGDDSDDIDGIEKIGPSKAFDLMTDPLVDKLIGTPEELEKRVLGGGGFFKDDAEQYVDEMNANWKRVFEDKQIPGLGYKLISYDMLIHWLEKRDMTEKGDWLAYMDKVITKADIPIIPSAKSFMGGMTILEDSWLQESDIAPLLEE